MGRGHAGGRRTSQQRFRSRHSLLHPLLRPDSLSQPWVGSSWEIYSGAINGFYRQLLERVEQGLAVEGPSRRLTAKTLKCYSPPYIKSLLVLSHRPPPPPDPGTWAMARLFQPLPAGQRCKCQQPLAPVPATKTTSFGMTTRTGGDLAKRQNQAPPQIPILPIFHLLYPCLNAPSFFQSQDQFCSQETLPPVLIPILGLICSDLLHFLNSGTFPYPHMVSSVSSFSPSRFGPPVVKAHSPPGLLHNIYNNCN